MRQLTLATATLVAGASLLPAAASARPTDLDRSRTPGKAAKRVAPATRLALLRRAWLRLAREAASEAAPAAVPTGPKIDPVLAEVVQQAAARADSPAVRVIAYGNAPAAALNRAGATNVERLTLIGAASGAVDPAQIPTLERDGDVVFVVVDSPVQRTSSGSSLPAVPSPSALVFPNLETLYPGIVGAQQAWSNGLTGRGVGIALVDSGVTPLADFGTRLTQVRLGHNGASLADSFGHGTFVAGVAGGRSADGRYTGIAPEASLYALNVARGDGVFTSDIIGALTWIAQNGQARGIRVVNLSLGETLPSSYKTSPLDAAIEQLWRDGFVVVASAGNSGPDTAQYAPANDPFIISVGASDPMGTAVETDDTIATFSTYGTTLDGFVKPDLVAPGRHVVAPVPLAASLTLQAPIANQVVPGYLRMNGTSFAAPQVAAAAALLLQRSPQLTPDQVKWLLLNTGSPAVSGTPGRSLDIAAALSFTGSVGYANVGLEASSGATVTDAPSGSLESAGEKRERSLARAIAWRGIAFDRSAHPSASVLANPKALRKAAAAWEQSGAYFNRAWAWSDAGAAWACAAQVWEQLGALDKAAAAWELSGGSYNKAGSVQSTSATWELAAFAYGRASGAYLTLGQAAKAETAATEREQAQFRSATWESATWESATWEASATWESATWESSSDWESSDDWS